MLVLTRRLNQTVNIFTEDGQQIRVTVMEDRGVNMGRQVRLGIETPPGTAIERDEVTREMNAEAVVMGVDPAAYCAQRRREMAGKRRAERETP